MNKAVYTMSQVNSNEYISIVDSEKAMKWIYMGDLDVAVWNKLYKKKLLEDNGITFDNEIWYGECMFFNMKCLQVTDKVVVGQKAIYHQTFNPNSAMRKFNLNSQFCGIKSLEIQKSLWKKRNKDIEKAWNYHRYCFNMSIIDGLVRADMVKDNREIYNDSVVDLRKRILLPLNMKITTKKKVMWLCYFVSPYIMAMRRKLKFKQAVKLSGGIKRFVDKWNEWQTAPVIIVGGACA